MRMCNHHIGFLKYWKTVYLICPYNRILRHQKRPQGKMILESFLNSKNKTLNVKMNLGGTTSGASAG